MVCLFFLVHSFLPRITKHFRTYFSPPLPPHSLACSPAPKLSICVYGKLNWTVPQASFEVVSLSHYTTNRSSPSSPTTFTRKIDTAAARGQWMDRGQGTGDDLSLMWLGNSAIHMILNTKFREVDGGRRGGRYEESINRRVLWEMRWPGNNYLYVVFLFCAASYPRPRSSSSSSSSSVVRGQFLLVAGFTRR